RSCARRWCGWCASGSASSWRCRIESAPMADSQIVNVIRMWAAVAWADGTLATAESESLIRLIRAAELTADERDSAMQLLEEPVEIPELYLRSLSPVARRGIYRAACRMAMVDRVFADAERWML